MKQLFAELFIWWHKQTLGTRWHTFLSGVHVGSDEAGNRYYKARKGAKRWVIYNGPADASAIPPGWHGWMHHRSDVTPDQDRYQARLWEKPHRANLSGTAAAYRPDGSLSGKGERARVSADYDAWSPE